ncbi:hypothetical protein [Streptomyces albipurpureus]|uniref:Secreted protein n=1 Tax=Streptomyces albipurpureus TaxID=2897419 RepID=A0ABT0UI44_9ACTN|nr:hypothetical protein [Streptomyces sp. CWNU-1]MCM2388302.1 hypothetical protein [Streptomyces sp. CWNU-1]
MSRHGWGRALAALAVVTASLVTSTLVTTPAAHAASKKWGNIYAQSGSTRLATANGDFANNGNVYATVGGNWWDLRNDNRPTYLKVEFFFKKGGKWRSAGTSKSDPTHEKGNGPISRRLRADATAARANIQVCVRRTSIAPDICSPRATPSFNY